MTRVSCSRWSAVVSRLGRRTFSLLVLLLSSTSPANAAQLSAYYNISSADGFFNVSNSLETAATGPLLGEKTLGAIFASFHVEYGEIGVYARDLGGGQPATGSPFDITLGGATAGFTDNLTITAPGVPMFSAGTLRVRVDVTGAFMASGLASANHIVDLGLSPSGGAQLSGTLYGAGHGPPLAGNFFGDAPGSYVFDLPMLFGMVSVLSLQALASTTVSTSEAGAATTDLGHTVAWGGVLAVLDSQGLPVGSFLIESESGYDYATLRPALVPEPDGSWLVLGGMGLLGLRMRSRRTPLRARRAGLAA